MSRQKGTPNKSKIEKKYAMVDVSLPDEEKTYLPSYEIKSSEYIICEGINPSNLCIHVIEAKESGYHCVGGIAIHDIRNPLTNEYEPHYYQAMEKLEN